MSQANCHKGLVTKILNNNLPDKPSKQLEKKTRNLSKPRKNASVVTILNPELELKHKTKPLMRENLGPRTIQFPKRCQECIEFSMSSLVQECQTYGPWTGCSPLTGAWAFPAPPLGILSC